MSWINPDSYLLIKTDEAIAFARKNSLLTTSDNGVAVFFNKKVLIKIYEERGYLHADYYDLQKLRWKRELENASISEGLIPIGKAQELYKKLEMSSHDDYLKASSMTQFYFYIKVVDSYMQDFLHGDLTRYEKFLQPLADAHRTQIESFVKKNIESNTSL